MKNADVTRANRRARPARFLGLIAAAGILSAAPSCLIINDDDQGAGQCTSNADCVDRHDGTTLCNSAHICVRVETLASCTTNQQCLDKDPNQICRKSDGVCVPLKTAECQTVVGDPARDDALMIGAILPVTGVDEAYGEPLELSIKLALKEIADAGAGVPTATPGVSRPILFIGCTDDAAVDAMTPMNAATHLSEELEVPAIIGGAFSGETITMANQVTINHGTLLLSPSAASDALTLLADNGLVWRTSPPDSLQAEAIKLYMTDLEANVQARFELAQIDPKTPVKLAVVNNTDPYGIALGDRLISDSPTPAFLINKAPVSDPSNAGNYTRSQYAAEDKNEQLAVATELAEVFHPSIVVLFGYTEVVSIMTSIESKWTGDPALRPLYVLSDAAMTPELTAAVGANDDLRSRIFGTVPGTNNPQFVDFVSRYDAEYPGQKAKYPASTFGAAGAYDAVYLLAFAAATTAGKPDTGKGLAEGLQKLSAGGVVLPEPKDLSYGSADLVAGGTRDYNGASGPLDFDNASGEAPSDIQLWCLPKVAGAAGAPISSGEFYDAASATLMGGFSACN